MKSSVFWDKTLYISLKVNRRFGATCHFHFHGRGMNQARSHHESATRDIRFPSSLLFSYTNPSFRQADYTAYCVFHAGFLHGLLFDPEDGGDMLL
jgi:hypothetical protein